MNIAEAIISRVLKDRSVTLTQLEHRATERGVLLSDLYLALDTVHRDKRIARKVTGGEIVYTPTPPKKTPIDHLKYVREHYPPMDSTNDGSGLEADYSYLFLSPEEAKEYRATLKGTNVWARKRTKPN